ncbi:MAG: zinc ABC transporter substrate-binding protein [Candidatus Abawacabacteria bacterium]|nr:zinc ABC transporter substrate-binding protein [Candidatus Abawacabacteria bacterium]
MKTHTFFASLIICSLALSSCGNAQPMTVETNKKEVVATFFPYYVFAKNLAGDYLSVNSLISSQVGPHDYQLKPSEINLLRQANLVIKNGLGVDDWVEKAITTSGSRAKVFTASQELTILPPIEEQVLIGAHEEEEDEHGPHDPHVWVSPRNVLQILPRISAQFQQLAPEHKAELAILLDQYTRQIEALDHSIRTETANLTNKQFVSFHSTTQYFARDYGFTVTASIEEYPGEEPTPYYLKQLIDYIKNNHIKVICTEPQFSPRIVQTLAQDLNLQIIEFDPMETGIYSPTAYQDVMLKNVHALAAALKA